MLHSRFFRMMWRESAPAIVSNRLDDRATSTSCAASCRHDASRPARLAPRRPTLDVSIGACSRMPRHTLQSLSRLLADPVSCTLYGLQRGTSLASWEARDDIGTLAVGSEPLGAVGSHDKPARTTERAVCYHKTLSSQSLRQAPLYSGRVGKVKS